MTNPDDRAVRASYDAVAADYELLLRHELDGRPHDRAMLAVFAELLAPGGAVADLGCGPGRITAHLRGLGVSAFGLDLSPGMAAVAAARHPALSFCVGSMTALPLADGALAGAVAWYSTVHMGASQLPAVFTECHRVLAPGGLLLHAFKAGDRVRRLSRAYGHRVSLDVHWTPPEAVAGALSGAGFGVVAQLIREPDADEAGPQAYVLARRGLERVQEPR